MIGVVLNKTTKKPQIASYSPKNPYINVLHVIKRLFSSLPTLSSSAAVLLEMYKHICIFLYLEEKKEGRWGQLALSSQGGGGMMALP